MSRSQNSHSSQAKPTARKRTSVQEAHVSQLLTIDQVAERLQVHRTTVYDFINLTGLKVTRLAAHAVRIDEADLKTWIEQRKAES
jgi:excisionase family DNA binding protein